MAQGTVFNFKAAAAGAPQSSCHKSPCAACRVRDLSICSALSADQLSRFTEIATDVSVPPGQPLFFEGDSAEHLFVIREGSARVYKLMADGRRMVTGFLFPSDIIGFAEDGRYLYGCEAIEGLAACRMPRRRLIEYFERYPALERRLLEIATNELAATQDQMLLLGRKTALEKLASFLHFLLRRQARRGVADDRIVLPMSRNDIGDHLGLTTESVSRCFTRLKKLGVIRLESAQRLRVADHARLLRLSGCGDLKLEPSAAALKTLG